MVHELTWLIRICCLSVQSATECNARCIFKLFAIISATAAHTTAAHTAPAQTGPAPTHSTSETDQGGSG